MYYELKENEKTLINKVEEVLLTKYELKGDLISVDDLLDMIDELTFGYEQLEQENKDLKRELGW